VASRPTVSSYAVLGLLAIKPWTGYELTQQATRSLRFAWPKSERLLYAEPRKLVDLGWATTHQEVVGGRTRNVYEITDDGREALEAWVTTRPEPPQLEAEALLRVLFAEHGSPANALASLDELREDAAALEAQVVEINRSYLDDGHPFPERVHLSVLFATFQVELFRLMQQWSYFAATEIESWPGTAGVGLTDRIAELIRRLGEPGPIIDGDDRADSPPGLGS
jgi:DNA-binding PadR family transcriptional regulator